MDCMGRIFSGTSKRQEIYRHPDAITDEALDWFLRLQDEPLDAAAREEFERWRQSDPKCDETYASLERMRGMPSLHRAVEKHVGPGYGRMPIRQPVAATPSFATALWSKRVAAVAAAVLLVVGLFQAPDLILRWRADHVTAVGQRETIQLSDGSTMTLNTDSAVALDFENGHRQVTLLKGEAFFDVRQDTGQSFLVTTGLSETEDLGTTFLVRRDEGEDCVILKDGLVIVRRLSDRAESVVLDPGEKVVVTPNALSPAKAVDIGQSFAWLDGYVILRDQVFSRALSTLRRYHDGAVIVAGDRLDEAKVSGNYNVDEPQTAIRTLAEAAGGTVTRLPGGILIIR